MWNPMFVEDDMTGQAHGAELSTSDWIALRRAAQLQSLTASQADRLIHLGLAEKTRDGVVCTRRGMDTLRSRP